MSTKTHLSCPLQSKEYVVIMVAVEIYRISHYARKNAAFCSKWGKQTVHMLFVSVVNDDDDA